MTINSVRLQQHFEEMSRIGQIGETGVCRPTLSPLEKQAFELAGGWMSAAGMQVRIDQLGNLIGRLQGRQKDAPVLMIGSHLDSQPYGGRFDGAAGVLCAIEAVTTLTEKGFVPERSIEVVSFADEEGWRFNKGLFGSRGMLGRLEDGELQRTDKEGISRETALRAFGCDPDRLAEAVYPEGSIYCFLELHIEQGPILDRANLPIGIVTGIAGPLWLTATLKGMAGHAGSVPMSLRQDALVGAAEIILELNQLAGQDPTAPTVGTIGSMKIFPDSRNIIPEEVSLTIDLRDIDLDRRNRYEAHLREKIAQIAKKHKLAYKISEDTNSPPRYCAPWIQDLIETVCQRSGLSAPKLMSGPFHDALALSYACDYGMIFVRCKDGISHNPLEYSSYEDLALGAEVLYGTMLGILQK